MSSFNQPEQGDSKIMEDYASTSSSDVEIDEVEMDEVEVQSVVEDGTDMVVTNEYPMDDLAYIAQFAVVDVMSAHVISSSENVGSIFPSASEVEEDGDSDEDNDEGDDNMLNEEDAQSVKSNEEDDDDEHDSDLEIEKSIREKSKLLQAKAEEGVTEEEAESFPSGPPRTKNEMVEDAVPLANIPRKLENITPEQLQQIGEVLYAIPEEHTIVVQAYHTMNPLIEGSMLCNNEGVILGPIQETFGPINTPFYIVRYRSSSATTAAATSIDKFKKDGNNNGKRKNNKKNKANKAKESQGESQSLPPVVTMDEEAGEDGEVAEVLEVPQSEITTQPMNDDTAKEEPIIPIEEPLVQIETKAIKEEEIPIEEDIHIPTLFLTGTQVYTLANHAHYLSYNMLSSLKTNKGSDASNVFDEEVKYSICYYYCMVAY